ncbi:MULTISPECIES: GNAT family N-acetyltransferase [Rothia]|uniref:GNAT family N-acetyltransferase n=2 Tax=Rothia kristinae TaxID=37923 RepID=A0A7T3CG13_9MICC|nr:GNAT family N-acetyltransferase [Rothia kristinae]TDP57007.1 acetyltransferase (GNAT) family protein [Kocuria sp. AG109]MBG7588195.1 GNAT family N-acetyltransferase [Rothia kristinae]MCA1169065.1 GNAT family N-acetyltransferase [Rothia kristinae]MCT1356885.1 GNAT family N-acetyltransferase [Rothia kristinae]MCT1393398.1 GNAT family N-acetyltransferase [Rothia kristinae]
MSGKITLIGDTWTSTRPVTVSTRPVARQDADGLARLFFTAYDDGSVTSQAHALEILHHMFDGEYGAVLPKASPVVVDDAGRIIAAALVLESRVGDDLPDSPYIFELFTESSRRREGFAEQLLRVAITELKEEGFEHVALRISEDNAAALALYLTLDFRRWFPEEDEL